MTTPTMSTTPVSGDPEQVRRISAQLAAVEARWAAGRVHVVRGGKRLLHVRHHLDQAQLTEDQWREQHQANKQEMDFFMTQIGEALDHDQPEEDDV